MKLFISPHNDDEALFGAFTIMREQPVLVVVYDGYIQRSRGAEITAEQRREETLEAAKCMCVDKVIFLGFRDDDVTVTANEVYSRVFDALGDVRPEEIFVPAHERGGNHHHNLVSEAFLVNADPKIVTNYLTYTERGKSRSPRKVAIQEGSWITKKLKALACYQSQHAIDSKINCWPHFVRDLDEYYV